MASTFTPLGIELQATGENAGTLSALETARPGIRKYEARTAATICSCHQSSRYVQTQENMSGTIRRRRAKLGTTQLRRISF